MRYTSTRLRLCVVRILGVLIGLGERGAEALSYVYIVSVPQAEFTRKNVAFEGRSGDRCGIIPRRWRNDRGGHSYAYPQHLQRNTYVFSENMHVALRMSWASVCVPRAEIPPAAWFYAAPIAGTPLEINVLPRELDLSNASNIIQRRFNPALAKAKTKERTLAANSTQA